MVSDNWAGSRGQGCQGPAPERWLRRRRCCCPSSWWCRWRRSWQCRCTCRGREGRGYVLSSETLKRDIDTNISHREGGVRRGHGLRSFRLSAFFRFFFHICLTRGVQKGSAAYPHCWAGTFTTFEVIRHAHGSSRRIQ
jgi:hypothetical protein